MRMTATSKGFYKGPSKHGGIYYYIPIHDDKISTHSYVHDQCDNFAPWLPVIELLTNKQDAVLQHCVLTTKNNEVIVNADSRIKVSPAPTLPTPPTLPNDDAFGALEQRQADNDEKRLNEIMDTMSSDEYDQLNAAYIKAIESGWSDGDFKAVLKKELLSSGNT